MSKQSSFKPVTFKGPFTQVVVHEKHIEYKHGFPFAKKGFIELGNIASVDFTFMTSKLRVGSKDGTNHEFQLSNGGKCRDLIMELKFK